MSSARPLVSVVIPTHNRAYCLAEAIDSVLSQSYENVEVIVVDDGSTDETPGLMASRYGSDARVHYIQQPKSDANVARNHGLRLARGEMVALLDSDDAFLPWKLELEVACLEAIPEAGMIWTDMDAVYVDGTVRPRFLRTMYSNYKRFPTEAIFPSSRPLKQIVPQLATEVGDAKVYVGDIFGPIAMGNLVHTSTCVLRRERLSQVGGFDVSLVRAGVDFDFHLRTCKAGPVAFADVVTIRYRYGMSDQMTHGSRRVTMAQNFLRTITPIIANDRERLGLSQSTIDDVLAEAETFLGESLVAQGQHSAARTHLLRSLQLRPRQPYAIKQLLISLLPVGLKADLQRVYASLRHRPS
ncbi:MAG TPA: glycosyltransferase [Polyangia bacterium]|nr:glycosyltransferase [Polyangia bacterium]